VLGIKDPKQRLAGSLACVMAAASAGAAIVRVHDVRESVEALRMLQNIQQNR
jgi:dihydropteroate synthase